MVRRALPALCVIVIVTTLTPFAVTAWRFRDRYVMVTVEESSSSALAGWPLLSERLPGSFVDCEAESVLVERRPFMLGVNLCLQYSATSQGIEFSDSLLFSRTGKAQLSLDNPLSYITGAMDGGQIELVDNSRRVVTGSLRVEGTSNDGAVTFRYGERRFTLGPGETWAELLVLTPDGPVAIGEDDWENELYSYMDQGYPTTRLAIANRGLWPKSGVTEEGER